MLFFVFMGDNRYRQMIAKLTSNGVTRALILCHFHYIVYFKKAVLNYFDAFTFN